MVTISLKHIKTTKAFNKYQITVYRDGAVLATEFPQYVYLPLGETRPEIIVKEVS